MHAEWDDRHASDMHVEQMACMYNNRCHTCGRTNMHAGASVSRMFSLTWLLHHVHHGHSHRSATCPPAKLLPDRSKLSAVGTPRRIAKGKVNQTTSQTTNISNHYHSTHLKTIETSSTSYLNTLGIKGCFSY